MEESKADDDDVNKKVLVVGGVLELEFASTLHVVVTAVCVNCQEPWRVSLRDVRAWYFHLRSAKWWAVRRTGFLSMLLRALNALAAKAEAAANDYGTPPLLRWSLELVLLVQSVVTDNFDVIMSWGPRKTRGVIQCLDAVLAAYVRETYSSSTAAFRSYFGRRPEIFDFAADVVEALCPKLMDRCETLPDFLGFSLRMVVSAGPSLARTRLLKLMLCPALAALFLYMLMVNEQTFDLLSEVCEMLIQTEQYEMNARFCAQVIIRYCDSSDWVLRRIDMMVILMMMRQTSAANEAFHQRFPAVLDEYVLRTPPYVEIPGGRLESLYDHLDCLLPPINRTPAEAWNAWKRRTCWMEIIASRPTCTLVENGSDVTGLLPVVADPRISRTFCDAEFPLWIKSEYAGYIARFL